jgi:hypothetical protein
MIMDTSKKKDLQKEKDLMTQCVFNHSTFRLKFQWALWKYKNNYGT